MFLGLFSPATLSFSSPSRSLAPLGSGPTPASSHTPGDTLFLARPRQGTRFRVSGQTSPIAKRQGSLGPWAVNSHLPGRQPGNGCFLLPSRSTLPAPCSPRLSPRPEKKGLGPEVRFHVYRGTGQGKSEHFCSGYLNKPGPAQIPDFIDHSRLPRIHPPVFKRSISYGSRSVGQKLASRCCFHRPM